MIGISTKTVYAIASLHELDALAKNEVMKIKEIAERASVPQSFLEQILLELRKKGLLVSIKGARGGYRLNKPLKDITLKEIVIILESDAFSDIGKTDNLALKLFWEEIQNGISKVFDIPLSELKQYQLQADQTLNYSI